MKTKYIVGAIILVAFGSFLTMVFYDGLTSKSDAPGKSNPAPFRATPVSLSTEADQGAPVDFTIAAAQTVQSVTHVKVRSTIPGQEIDDPIAEFFYGRPLKEPARRVTGYGSGVIISPDGYIITNNHVVEDSDSIGVILNDKTTYKAKLIGRDPDTDIALIKVPATGLPVIKFGNSDELRLGQWVLAVGNPFNLGTTVTAGIISAKGRSLEIPGDNEFKLDSYIQTDAALNPGNSGGALVNTRSELVGITAAIISPTGAYSGNSFAIPGNTVKKVAYDLLKYGKVQRGILGLSISEITPELSAKEGLKNINGVFVLDVATGSGAADAGIKARDVILKVESTSIGSPSEFQEQVSLHSPGDRLNITYLRKGAEKTVPVTLKEQKAAKP